MECYFNILIFSSQRNIKIKINKKGHVAFFSLSLPSGEAWYTTMPPDSYGETEELSTTGRFIE